MQDLQLEHHPQDKPSWLALAQELDGYLRKVLQDLSFIGRYDLIRVLTQGEQSYTFKLYKDIQVLEGKRPLPKHISLTNGQLYLRTATEGVGVIQQLRVRLSELYPAKRIRDSRADFVAVH